MDHNAVREVFVLESTRFWAKAFMKCLDSSSHFIEGMCVAKPIFLVSLMDNWKAFRLSEQNRKWLLPVCHKPRVNISFKMQPTTYWTLVEKLNPFFAYSKSPIDLSELIEEGD